MSCQVLLLVAGAKISVSCHVLLLVAAARISVSCHVLLLVADARISVSRVAIGCMQVLDRMSVSCLLQLC